MMHTEPSVFVGSTEEGIKRVRESNGRYGFFAEVNLLDFVNNQYPCDTMTIDKPVSSKAYGIALQKGSPHRYHTKVFIKQNTTSNIRSTLLI